MRMTGLAVCLLPCLVPFCCCLLPRWGDAAPNKVSLRWCRTPPPPPSAGRIDWYQNNGANPPVWTKQSVTTTGGYPMAVYSRDMVRDATVDVVRHPLPWSH